MCIQNIEIKYVSYAVWQEKQCSHPCSATSVYRPKILNTKVRNAIKVLKWCSWLEQQSQSLIWFISLTVTACFDKIKSKGCEGTFGPLNEDHMISEEYFIAKGHQLAELRPFLSTIYSFLKNGNDSRQWWLTCTCHLWVPPLWQHLWVFFRLNLKRPMTRSVHR